ncbi:MAG: hypothetical protein AAGJ46_10555 [Planctomycetota bacterium]
MPGKILSSAFAFIAVIATLPGAAEADLVPGYTLGAGSQLLTANGGAGTVLFEDSAALGGNLDVDNASGTASFNSVLLDGSGLWSIGDNVTITGVAFTLVGGSSSNRTKSGTFTIDVRQGAGGSGPSGAGGLSSLGTQTADYTQPAVGSLAEVMYVNFDTPISFVADANSTSIGVNFTSDGGHIRYKATSATTLGGLPRYNFANGNQPGSFQFFSIAGSVAAIPEPTSFAFLGLASLGVVIGRGSRRR